MAVCAIAIHYDWHHAAGLGDYSIAIPVVAGFAALLATGLVLRLQALAKRLGMYRDSSRMRRSQRL